MYFQINLYIGIIFEFDNKKGNEQFKWLPGLLLDTKWTTERCIGDGNAEHDSFRLRNFHEHCYGHTYPVQRTEPPETSQLHIYWLLKHLVHWCFHATSDASVRDQKLSSWKRVQWLAAFHRRLLLIQDYVWYVSIYVGHIFEHSARTTDQPSPNIQHFESDHWVECGVGGTLDSSMLFRVDWCRACASVNTSCFYILCIVLYVHVVSGT